MNKEVSLRLVPFNTEITKLLALHGLNPLIDLKCKLSTSLLQVVEYLKKYISKGKSIDSIIGYKNEIKLAPELDLIKPTPKRQEESKGGNEGRVVVWSQNTAKGILLKDIYILVNFKDPIYLYYYWDEMPSSEQGIFNNYYYITEQAKDKILDKNEYEDFIEMVANVVQNVLVKKKRRNRKRNLPEPNKTGVITPKAIEVPEKESCRLKIAKTSPSSEVVYDLEKPFESLFKHPRPQTVNPQGVVKKLFDSDDKVPSCIIIDEPKEKKGSCEPLQQSESEKSSRVLPFSGSAANSMRIMAGQIGGNYSGLPLLDLSEMAEMDKTVQRNNQELKKTVGIEKGQKKAVKQKNIQNEEQRTAEDIKLPHPNEAFKMYAKGIEEKFEKEYKNEEVNSFW